MTEHEEPMRSVRPSRRAFLRGAGVCLALPALESFAPRSAGAATVEATQRLAATATGAPLRTVFLSFPNGAIPAAWRSRGTGADHAFGKTLEPLAELRGKVRVLSGLDLAAAEPGPDGGGDHARGNATFLTGMRLNKSATDLRVGVSIDQVIAARVGSQTRFASLELSGDPNPQSGGCDSGYACAYQYNISWKSPTTPMTAESNPRLLFERLFGAGRQDERAANHGLRLSEQRSVLDFVLEESRSMRRVAGASDRRKLDEYLDAVRDIERRVERSGSHGPAPDPGIDAPRGVSSDYQEYLSQMFELLAIALDTDSTRVATFQIAHDGSNRSFGHIGVFEGHHDLTHHRNREDWVQKVAEIDRWYVQQLAAFLKRLDAARDADGLSVLDNSQIVYGSGNADGNRHTHSDLPIVLAGGAGGAYEPGRHADHGATPLANLYLRMAHTAGLTDLERFADSTGPLRGV